MYDNFTLFAVIVSFNGLIILDDWEEKWYNDILKTLTKGRVHFLIFYE